MNLYRFCWIPLVAFMLNAADPSWETLRDLGRWKSLRSQVEKAYRAKPEDPSNLYWMSQVELASGHSQVAYDLAKKAVALKPGIADYQCGLGMASMRLIAKVNPIKKIFLSSEGKKACEAALAIDAKHVDALQFLVGFYSEAPGFVGGDPKWAAVLLKSLASINPAQAYLFEANMAETRKDLAKTEALYVKALATDPKNHRAHSGLAMLCLDPSNKKPLDAVKHAKEAIRLEPKWVEGHSALTKAYADMEQWKELDASLLEAEKSLPDNLEPYYAAARTLFLKFKDFPRVERYFKKYLGQEAEVGAPGHAFAHWRLGLVYEKLNRKTEALAELETAVRMEPEAKFIQQDLRRMK